MRRPCLAVTHGSADLELILPMHCKALQLQVPECLRCGVDKGLGALETPGNAAKIHGKSMNAMKKSMKNNEKSMKIQLKSDGNPVNIAGAMPTSGSWPSDTSFSRAA